MSNWVPHPVSGIVYNTSILGPFSPPSASSLSLICMHSYNVFFLQNQRRSVRQAGSAPLRQYTSFTSTSYTTDFGTRKQNSLFLLAHSHTHAYTISLAYTHTHAHTHTHTHTHTHPPCLPPSTANAPGGPGGIIAGVVVGVLLVASIIVVIIIIIVVVV